MSENVKSEIADCYSEGERASMRRYQNAKLRLLGPLLAALTAIRLTPNAVTFLSLLAGLAFCPLYVLPQYLNDEPQWPIGIAWMLLLAHVIIDGVDGPLARFQGVAGRRGSFTDTTADQIALAATTLAFMHAQLVGQVGLGLYAGGAYIFLYTVVVAFAMVRNAMSIPYRFVFRPRYWVMSLLFVEWVSGSTELMGLVTEISIWIFNAMLAFYAYTGFVAIRRKL